MKNVCSILGPVLSLLFLTSFASAHSERCVQELKKGKPIGMRCFDNDPNSIWSQIGMKSNDVLCGVNGKKITNSIEAFAALGRLRSTDPNDATYETEICIIHDGKKTVRKVKNSDVKKTEPSL